MHDYILDRARRVGEYIVETRSTIRKTAKDFGLSKTLVYLDVTTRLKEVDLVLYKEVNEVLQYHKSIRHLRGGEATRKLHRGDRI